MLQARRIRYRERERARQWQAIRALPLSPRFRGADRLGPFQRRRFTDATARAPKGIRLADKRPLRVGRGAKDASLCAGRGDRCALRRNQTTPCPRVRASPDETRAHRYSVGPGPGVLALGAPPSGALPSPRLGWVTIAERPSKARGEPPGAKILYSIGEKLFGRLRALQIFSF
jgi:hypothetical protein